MVFVVTSLLLWLVWLFVAAQFTVTTSPTGRTFKSGDRLLVSRMSYGVRVPFMNLTGYRRLGECSPRINDWMAFNLPTDTSRNIDMRPVVVGKLLALPGDTVRLTRDRVFIFGTPEYSHLSFVVPAKNKRVLVTRQNARLLCNMINMHEPCHAAVMYGDTLYVDGHPARYITFTQNFYWAYSGRQSDFNDSRSFGFVPENHIIGRVACILYSVDSRQPFYRMFRSGRFFSTP